MKLWFDFTNPPHVNFFCPLIKKFKAEGNDTTSTARDFAETIRLLKLNDIGYKVYGQHRGKKKVKKIGALLERCGRLLTNMQSFDLSFSSNYEAPFISWLRRKPAFVFDDNDISPNWLYSKFAKFVFSPRFINKDNMFKMGISPKKLILYEGFKEQIYAADYKADPSFIDLIPFENFVTVRPENVQASYVPLGVKSIVPELIRKITKRGMNVLYLPRYEADKEFIHENDKVFIPDGPLNGLDVCYYSDAVLTGAGSFSREAAVMGTPAVSFFAGNDFLGVDKEMFRNRDVYYSRNTEKIVKFIIKSKKKGFDPAKCKSAQDDLFLKLDTAMKS